MKFLKTLLMVFGLSLVVVTPVLAMSDDSGVGAAIGIVAVFFIVGIVVTIFFLLAQSSFVDTIQTSNPLVNTSKVWIWTQLIPIWSLIAIPVTLLKINTQFQVFVQEKGYTQSDIKYYTSLWGWIWFGGNIASILIPVMGIVSLVGVIGFWVHLNSVKKSILMHELSNSSDTQQEA